jgi:hypothetical protein
MLSTKAFPNTFPLSLESAIPSRPNYFLGSLGRVVTGPTKTNFLLLPYFPNVPGFPRFYP